MADYRWNQHDTARGYDAAAAVVHPYYWEIQDVILQRLALVPDGLVVDLGGGSGRLGERILLERSQASVCVIDQSESSLTLARERLERFGSRATCLSARLQSDWPQHLNASPQAIVSMSAIHHLDAHEKSRLYQQAAECLAPSGVLLNGDEVRPEADAEYLRLCRQWAAHMHHEIDGGRVPESLHAALLSWETRNVTQFGEPRTSGDDCHETAEAQINYFRACGLASASVIWQRDLWAVLFAQRQVTP